MENNLIIINQTSWLKITFKETWQGWSLQYQETILRQCKEAEMDKKRPTFEWAMLQSTFLYI